MTPSNDAFPGSWCRMWNEEPALAHRLIAEDGRQWAARLTGLDTVVGPRAAQEFVAAYAEKVGNRFEPRTLVIGDDLVAYTWDATKRDGSVVTGMDFNVLRDGRVVDNWTFAGPWRDAQSDGPGQGSLTGPQLADLARADAEERGVRLHRPPAVDAVRQSMAYLWVTEPDLPGGLDVVVVRDGSCAQRWSMPAYRAFRY